MSVCDYQVATVGAITLVKSGTDFRFLTEITLDFSTPTVSPTRTIPFTVTTTKHAVTTGARCPLGSVGVRCCVELFLCCECMCVRVW